MKYTTYKSILTLFPSSAWLAERLSISAITVRAWGNRNSIPSANWNKIVKLAYDNGIKGVTLEVLASIASRSNTKIKETTK